MKSKKGSHKKAKRTSKISTKNKVSAKVETAAPSKETSKTESKRAVNYAGFWVRFMAGFIDLMLIWLVFEFIEGISQTKLFMFTDSLSGFMSSISLIILWLYFSLMESSEYQASVGKMCLGLKVTDLDSKKLSFVRATGRTFSKLVSILTLGIGFIMIGLTDNKQGLHDRIADTLVVKK